MKIQIKTDPSLGKDEIILLCHQKNEKVQQIKRLIDEMVSGQTSMVVYKDKQEIYLPVSEILFFETSGTTIYAHTAKEMYETSYKLYELEEILPGYFLRVSKSSIANIHQIVSISRNLTASSTIAFNSSHKQAYVSRHYFRTLKLRLEEKRNFYEKKKT